MTFYYSDKGSIGPRVTNSETGRWLSPGMIEAYAAALPADQREPIPMILHCPACHTQHIDAPEPGMLISSGPTAGRVRPGWTNPPHRSHLCQECGHVWRPADVPTTGVKSVQTRGKNDSEVFP
jgi:rubredoxin